MLITRASEYALLALIEISQAQKPVKTDQLAKTLSIPKSFLAKILQNMAKKEILHSYKGANGGFALGKDLSSITILAVITAVEGDNPSVFDCSSSIQDCPNSAVSCRLWPFLNKLQGKIDTFLDELTMQDLI